MVVVDAGYGDNPNFLRGLDERQIPYICAVESTFGCRLLDEVQAAALQPPTYQGRGQPRKPRPAPLHTVKDFIEALPASAWRTISWREGTKGTMQVQAVAIRVHWATGSSRHATSHSRVQTGPEGWLLAERPVPGAETGEQDTQAAKKPGKKPEQTKYRFSTLPASTPLERLVLLVHARWVIEQFYEDAKQECGLDHFQGRSWNGLHRHLALVLLAYSFLMLHRLTLPPDEAFSPLRLAKLAAWRASPDAALALPGSRPLATAHPAGRVLPPQKELTK
jgi:SRSO17 transposase